MSIRGKERSVPGDELGIKARSSCAQEIRRSPARLESDLELYSKCDDPKRINLGNMAGLVFTRGVNRAPHASCVASLADRYETFS